MRSIFFCCLMLLFSSGHADNRTVFSPPIQHPKSRYLEIWNNSPFELEAAPEKVVSQTTEVAKLDFFLAGVMRRGENDIVYIQNRRTGAVVKASSTPNPSGFILKQLTPADTPGEYIAKVERQGELLTLNYERGVPKSSSSGKSKDDPGPASTAAKSGSKSKPDFNPAQLALDKARQQAAKARAHGSKTKEDAAKGKAPNHRKRTIFVP